MKTAIYFFLVPEDERYLSYLLHRSIPSLTFVDGQDWPTKIPPTKGSINECVSKWVYLWDISIFPTLPVTEGDRATFRGPQSGCVIQMERCHQKDDTLFCGNINYASHEGPHSEAMDELMGKLKKIFARYFLSDTTPKGANHQEAEHAPVTPRQFIGLATSRWLESNRRAVLRDRSVQNFYTTEWIAFLRHAEPQID